MQPIGNRVFKLGDTGPVVVEIQLALRARGYALKGTGYYGSATNTAVSAFQRRAGLVVDGRVGALTAAALDKAPMASQLSPAQAEEIGRSLWLEAGVRLLGTMEVPGKGNNPTIMEWAEGEGGDIARDYTHDVIPFCSLFMNHILTKAGLEGTETLWALDWNADDMQKRLGRRWPGIRLPGPAVGAIAPMLRNGGGHVICVVGRDQHGHIMGLGSNQSDTTSIIPFPVTRLNKGFWWPERVGLPKLIGFDKLPLVRSDGRLSLAEA